MYFKHDKSLVIVFIMKIYLARFALSEVTPILNPHLNELGSKCLALPSVTDSTLELLVEKHCYVDKTEYLIKMVSVTQKFWFLARPRRFGKTLLLHVIQAFFTGQKELFKDTLIYQKYVKSFLFIKYTSGWPKYPVIQLDFNNGIATHSVSAFRRTLLSLMKRKAELHNIYLDAQEVPEAISELIEKLHKKYKKPVVILIDEYDGPYTESFVKSKEVASQILGTLQSFFKTMKSMFKEIRFCFVTGITRLALSDFFSGANAMVDLTMDPGYTGIVGFNETELCQYFGGFIKDIAKTRRQNPTEVLKEMEEWHDGFRFSVKNESLYSPISVIGYLGSMGDEESWSETGGPSQFLIERLKEFPADALEIFLDDKINHQDGKSEDVGYLLTAHRAELTGKFNFDNCTDSIALTALLFHNGYLSISGYDKKTKIFTLKFSNLELRKDYASRLYYSFTGKPPRRLNDLMDSMVQDLDKGQWKAFIGNLNTFNSQIPYQLLANQHKVLEVWYQFTMFVLFHFSKWETQKDGRIIMEDSTNQGRVDILFSVEGKMYLFEPKLSKNPENPLYECKQKYVQKHLFGRNKNVVCFGLKFLNDGVVKSWGVAIFSREGKLLNEDGNIALKTQFNIEEKQQVIKQLNDFKRNHPTFTLEPDKLIEFLEKIGPTTTHEKVFVSKFTEDEETLCLLLNEIKISLPKSKDNLKGVMFSLLKRLAPKQTKEAPKKMKKAQKKIKQSQKL